jgi:hypothetical protein
MKKKEISKRPYKYAVLSILLIIGLMVVYAAYTSNSVERLATLMNPNRDLKNNTIATSSSPNTTISTIPIIETTSNGTTNIQPVINTIVIPASRVKLISNNSVNTTYGSYTIGQATNIPNVSIAKVNANVTLGTTGTSYTVSGIGNPTATPSVASATQPVLPNGFTNTPLVVLNNGSQVNHGSNLILIGSGFVNSIITSTSVPTTIPTTTTTILQCEPGATADIFVNGSCISIFPTGINESYCDYNKCSTITTSTSATTSTSISTIQTTTCTIAITVNCTGPGGTCIYTPSGC